MASFLLDGAFEGLIQRPSSKNSESDRAENRFRDVPGIPPLLLCAIALWASIAVSYSFFAHLQDCTLRAIATAFLALAVLAAIAMGLARRPLLSLVLFATLGISIGSLAVLGYQQASSTLPSSSECLIVLDDDPKKSSRGSYAVAECRLGDGRTIKARAFFSDELECLARTRLFAKCSFTSPNDEYAESDYLAGVVAQANVSSYEILELPFLEGAIYGVRESAIGAIDRYAQGEAAVLEALLCGYRPNIQDEGGYESFKRCGAAHMIAVSGAHLSIMSMTFAALLKLLRLPKTVFVGLNVMLICAYLVFAGIPISALRAAAMCALSLVSGLARRRNATLNSLSVCIIAILLMDPASSVSVSLFLSAASTFSIVMFSGLFCSWAENCPKAINDYIAVPLSLTLSANVATLPFSASLFGLLPLISPISNIVMAPLFTICCVVGIVCLAATLLIAPLAPLAMGVAALCACPLDQAAALLSSVPNSSIDVDLETIPMLLLSAAAVLCLWIFRPKPSKSFIVLPLIALCAFFAASAITIPGNDENKIVMLDVGQGDAFVLQSRGKTLLIDTGNDDRKLADSLRHAGISRIDAVSISHSDDDHCDSMDSLGILSADAVFLCADDMLSCNCEKCSMLVSEAKGMFGDESVMGLSIGDVFKVGDFKVELIWPRAYADEGGNCDSACFLASLDSDGDGESDCKALFTGDAESEELRKMQADSAIGDIDVLKVGHHGSRKSLDADLAEALDPEYALISAGEGNSYGHPTKEAVEALQSVGASILRTDLNGVVELNFLPTGIKVVEQRNG